ncbi:MAG: hypothetical protein NZ703_03680 [Gemmataceae bacterium]|nr:hypothetical protein [Gemmataceae bacterium]MCS7270163.1 hypothetical protein [Gemmataceae bacterium]MDW8243492.1 hypothetical protein [Thermogemmata sp.]
MRQHLVQLLRQAKQPEQLAPILDYLAETGHIGQAEVASILEKLSSGYSLNSVCEPLQMLVAKVCQVQVKYHVLNNGTLGRPWKRRVSLPAAVGRTALLVLFSDCKGVISIYHGGLKVRHYHKPLADAAVVMARRRRDDVVAIASCTVVRAKLGCAGCLRANGFNGDMIDGRCKPERQLQSLEWNWNYFKQTVQQLRDDNYYDIQLVSDLASGPALLSDQGVKEHYPIDCEDDDEDWYFKPNLCDLSESPDSSEIPPCGGVIIAGENS